MIRHLMLTAVFTFVTLVDEKQIRRALELCGISVTKLAVFWERDRSYVERQLKDERPFQHRDLAKLPLKFSQWYHFLMLVSVGMPEELQHATAIETAITDYERQLALFEQSDERKRA